ncbi:MAG: hypothetical protein WEF86_14720 [Gemmatimonadota bacterium]
MTQGPRTTETINRDNAGIRDIMHRIKNLTVPDRATLALGLVGHLATMMSRSQMTKLLGELTEEAARVQDVPPSRQREQPSDNERLAQDGRPAARAHEGASEPSPRPDRGGMQASSVGQAGRGEFRSGELL